MNEELKEFIIENEKAIYSVINRYRRYYEMMMEEKQKYGHEEN